MVLLTGYVVLPEQKFAVGTITQYIVWMLIFFNGSIILLGSIKGLIDLIKEKYKKVKRKTFIKE